jgi:hypothetical protein
MVIFYVAAFYLFSLVEQTNRLGKKKREESKSFLDDFYTKTNIDEREMRIKYCI